MAIAFKSSNCVEAQLVAGLLESKGLKVLVLDANLTGVDPLYAIALGGIKVVVPDQQLAAAREILEAFRGAGGARSAFGQHRRFRLTRSLRRSMDSVVRAA